MLAHRLKMTTTAEGVETAEELDFVRRSDCDAVQGYFFSPPLPFDALKTFIAGFAPISTSGGAQPGTAQPAQVPVQKFP